MNKRAKAAARIGVRSVQCVHCGKTVLEACAWPLRRLWLSSPPLQQERGLRIMYFACSRRCASSRKQMLDHQVVANRWDSSVWIDRPEIDK